MSPKLSPAVAGYLVAGAVAVAALWLLTRPGVARAVAKGAATATADLADGVVSGTVVGVGALVGIPDTDVDDCARAMRAGSAWDASFACPAARFVRWIAAGKPVEGVAP